MPATSAPRVGPQGTKGLYSSHGIPTGNLDCKNPFVWSLWVWTQLQSYRLSLQLIVISYNLLVWCLWLVLMLSGSFMQKNKSGQKVDPDKPGFTASCHRGQTDPLFFYSNMATTSPQNNQNSQLAFLTLESARVGNSLSQRKIHIMFNYLTIIYGSTTITGGFTTVICLFKVSKITVEEQAKS